MLAFQFLSNKRLFHFKRDIYWISFLFLRYRWFERIGFFSIRRNERKQKKFVHKRGNPRQLYFYPARALRALGLLLADGTPTGGRGEDFLSRQPDFFTETAVTSERKVEKSFPRWEINRHVEG